MNVQTIKEQLTEAYHRLDKLNVCGIASAEQVIVISRLIASAIQEAEKEVEHGETPEA